MLGPTMGPLLGGWLTETYHWRRVFLINLPVGVLAQWGLLRYLPHTRSAAEPCDWT